MRYYKTCFYINIQYIYYYIYIYLLYIYIIIYIYMYMYTPSLKLTWPLKMDGWNTSFLFGMACINQDKGPQLFNPPLRLYPERREDLELYIQHDIDNIPRIFQGNISLWDDDETCLWRFMECKQHINIIEKNISSKYLGKFSPTCSPTWLGTREMPWHSYRVFPTFWG